MVDDPNHILLIDIHSAEVAIHTVEIVRQKLTHARVVLLESECDRGIVRQAFAQGVDGYLARQTSCQPLLLMLDLVSLGEKVLPRKFVDDFSSHPQDFVPKRLDGVTPNHGLSDREFGILCCLVDGDPNKIIARKLGITEATVKIHVKGILRKLHVLNRTQAAIWMVNQNLAAGAAIPPRSGAAQTATGAQP